MVKRFAMLLLLFVMLMTLAVPASASGLNDATTPEDSGVGGIVPPKGAVASPSKGAITLLTYHGGPIMVSSKIFTIFWVPAGYTVAPGYASLINRYFQDVARASGATSNVYYTEKQYFMTGPVYVSGKTVYGGSYLDTHAFPRNGCPVYSASITRCFNDNQIKTEIKRVLAVKGWVGNSVNMFFMFTPMGVGSCFGSSAGSGCAFTDYCAYHGYTGAITYANQPYTDTVPAACDVSTSPNGNIAADSTINVASHEHREAINDYHLNAWWDSATGMEGSDKCAWNFGSLAPGYNQTIAGHHYVLQKEWSNYSRGCVLTGK